MDMPPPRRVAALCAPALALLLLAGCSARLTLPDPPPQPRTVVFLDHGGHSSLIVTDAQAVPWRFACGDWRWYVEQRTGPLSAANALLWPSQAALGRQALQPRAAERGWLPQIGSLIRSEVSFEAEAGRVDATLASLHAVFDQTDAAPHYVPHLQLHVVPHPAPYTLDHNSNHMVANWLRAVGARVDGYPAFGRWEVVP